MTFSTQTYPNRRRGAKSIAVMNGFYKGLAIVGSWTVFGFILVTILGLAKVAP